MSDFPFLAAASAALFGETFMIRTQEDDFKKNFTTFDVWGVSVFSNL